MQTITVTPNTHNDKFLAKGEGRQRTVKFNEDKSSDWNFGTAAGTLADVLGWQPEDNITRLNSVSSVQFTNHSR